MHVDARFDATFEYAYSFQNDFAAKHNWSYASAECEPQQTRTCLTKICVNDDSDWSGLANCTCDGDVMTPPKHSPLDRMRRSWKRLDKIKVKKPMNTTVDSSQLVVLDEKELWQVDPYNDGQRKIGGSIMIELASDFELWYDRKALIIPMSNNGVRMCNVSMNDEAGSFLGCQCALFCPANTFEQLDSNSIPLKSHVALDWIHGKYYWTGRRLEIGAVGVYDVASKRRRVLFSGLRSHIHPEKIVVDPIDGFLFWVDASRRAIVRTDTDGRNLTEIVKMWDVGAIALDIKERRIYWLATHRYHAIASTDYDGKDTRMVLQSCHFVQGFEPSLAVLDDRVFWTTGDALLSVSKNGGERVPRIHYVAETDIESVKVWYSPSQPEGQNKCDNHRCAWMCLPRSSGSVLSARNSSVAEDRLSYSCACPLGQRSVWRDGSNFCVDDKSERHGILVPL